MSLMIASDFSRFGIDLATDSCQAPWDFAAESLQRVSRTFALNIQVLPKNRLRRPVLLAYLFCRMADTVEDSTTLGALEKQRLLELFSDIFTPHSDWKNSAKAFVDSLPAKWKQSEDDEEFLCVHCSWMIELYEKFPNKVKTPISQCVREMCEGMASFALRQESSQGTWLTIESEADLDRYCYFVAGVVGNMLCDLFYTQSPWISAERHREMRKLAVSFGLALQVTNIIKDVAEDSTRNVCFIPVDWMRIENITSPQALFAPTVTPATRSKVIGHLVRKSWKHLQDSMDFTRLIPVLEPRIRLFCLWPMLMSAETLVATGDGSSVFDPNVKVKITRADVKRILSWTVLRCWNGSLLQQRLDDLRKQSPH